MLLFTKRKFSFFNEFIENFFSFQNLDYDQGTKIDYISEQNANANSLKVVNSWVIFSKKQENYFKSQFNPIFLSVDTKIEDYDFYQEVLKYKKEQQYYLKNYCTNPKNYIKQQDLLLYKTNKYIWKNYYSYFPLWNGYWSSLPSYQEGPESVYPYIYNKWTRQTIESFNVSKTLANFIADWLIEREFFTMYQLTPFFFLWTNLRVNTNDMINLRLTAFFWDRTLLMYDTIVGQPQELLDKNYFEPYNEWKHEFQSVAGLLAMSKNIGNLKKNIELFPTFNDYQYISPDKNFRATWMYWKSFKVKINNIMVRYFMIKRWLWLQSRILAPILYYPSIYNDGDNIYTQSTTRSYNFPTYPDNLMERGKFSLYLEYHCGLYHYFYKAGNTYMDSLEFLNIWRHRSTFVYGPFEAMNMDFFFYTSVWYPENDAAAWFPILMLCTKNYPGPRYYYFLINNYISTFGYKETNPWAYHTMRGKEKSYKLYYYSRKKKLVQFWDYVPIDGRLHSSNRFLQVMFGYNMSDFSVNEPKWITDLQDSHELLETLLIDPDNDKAHEDLSKNISYSFNKKKYNIKNDYSLYVQSNKLPNFFKEELYHYVNEKVSDDPGFFVTALRWGEKPMEPSIFNWNTISNVFYKTSIPYPHFNWLAFTSSLMENISGSSMNSLYHFVWGWPVSIGGQLNKFLDDLYYFLTVTCTIDFTYSGRVHTYVRGTDQTISLRKFAFITAANSPSMQGYYWNFTLDKEIYFLCLRIIEDFGPTIKIMHEEIDWFKNVFNFLISYFWEIDLILEKCFNNIKFSFFTNNLFEFSEICSYYEACLKFFKNNILNNFLLLLEHCYFFYYTYLDSIVVFVVGDWWKFLFHWNLPICSVTSYYIESDVKIWVSYVNDIYIYKRWIPYKFYTFLDENLESLFHSSSETSYVYPFEQNIINYLTINSPSGVKQAENFFLLYGTCLMQDFEWLPQLYGKYGTFVPKINSFDYRLIKIKLVELQWYNNYILKQKTYKKN